jgi:hypothetical protein
MIAVHLQFSCKAQNFLNLLCTGGHSVRLMNDWVGGPPHIQQDELLSADVS